MKNKDLKRIYESIYKKGKEKFFTYKTSDITKEVVSELSWKNRAVLEVGCGTGETAYFLALSGAKITAMDYSENAIRQALKKYSFKGLDFRVGSFDDITGKYDCIVMQEVIEHTDNPYNILRLLSKHIKRSGHLIITCPSFLNIRGIVWMTLKILFDLPMSLTDKHFILPSQMQDWARKLNLKLSWRTFRYSQAHGVDMFNDMRKRLKNALRDARMDNSKTDELLDWLKELCSYEKNERHNGAKALYHFIKP